MVRKDYPFNRRESKRMTSKLTNLFLLLISTPILLIKGSSNLKVNIEKFEKPQEINPYRIKVVNIICGICYFLSPFIGALLVTEFGWWIFFALIFSVLFEVCFSMATPSPYEISNNYIFTQSEVKNQIEACKSSFKLWSIINILHICLSFIIFLCIMFDLHYRLFDYDLTTWNTIMPWSSFLLSLNDISIYTLFLIVLWLYFKTTSAIANYKHFKLMEEYVKKNPFYKKIVHK